MFEIVSIERTPADMWLARVVISSDETQFFKFQQEPTQEEVDAAAAAYLQLHEER